MPTEDILNFNHILKFDKLKPQSFKTSLSLDVRNQVFAKANELTSYLSQQAVIYNSIVDALLIDSSLISNATVFSDNNLVPLPTDTGIDDLINKAIVLEDEIGEMLKRSFAQIMGVNGLFPGGWTFTNADGESFPLRIYTVVDYWGVKCADQLFFFYSYATHKWYWTGVLKSLAGNMKSFESVISDIINSCKINDILSKLIQCCMQGSLEMFNSTLNSLKNIAYDAYVAIRDRFFTDGLGGGIMVILQWLRVTFSDNGDNTFSFTNNDTFVPKVYLAGIVNSVVSAVSQVVAAATTTVNGIARVILALLAAAFQGTSAFFNQLEDKSHAQYVVDDKFRLPVLPFSSFQQTIPDYTSVLRGGWSNLFSDIENGGVSTFYVEVPGGYLIGGPGPDQGRTTMNVEFHPGHNDVSLTLSKALYYISTHNGLSVSSSSGMYPFTLNYGFSDPTDYLALRTLILDSLNNDVVLDEATETGVYSSNADDKNLRDRIFQNMLLYYVWVQFCQPYPGVVSKYGSTFLDLDTINGIFKPASLGYENIYGDYNTTQYLEVIFPLYLIGYTGHLNALHSLYPIEWYWSYQGNSYVSSMPNTDQVIPSWAQLITISNMSSNINTVGLWFIPTLVDEVTGDYDDQEFSYGRLGVVLNFQILPPVYNRFKSIVLWSLIGAATVISVGIASFATVKFMRWRRQQLALNAAKANKAWEALSNDPSPEAYRTYLASAKKNNIWATVLGGEKISKTDYWNGSAPGDSGSDETYGYTSLWNALETIANTETNTQGTMSDTERIIRILSGSY